MTKYEVKATVSIELEAEERVSLEEACRRLMQKIGILKNRGVSIGLVTATLIEDVTK